MSLGAGMNLVMPAQHLVDLAKSLRPLSLRLSLPEKNKTLSAYAAARIRIVIAAFT
jgi:hypothetical protein